MSEIVEEMHRVSDIVLHNLEDIDVKLQILAGNLERLGASTSELSDFQEHWAGFVGAVRASFSEPS
eukprot:gene11183-3241_t